MNRSLLDPFSLAQEYPDSLSDSLRWGHSGCIKFSRKGDYLASGLVSGTVVIFDIDTNGVLVTLKGHTMAIQSLR